MTSLVEAGDGRKVVQLFGPRRRSARHAALHRPAAGRHARVPSRVVRPLRVAQPGAARHAVVPTVRTRRRHDSLDRYDRFLLWGAGWLLRLRIALIGESPVDWR
ncbi:hypothetical protein NDR87_28465 [Nocardia sp. CDC159]|uniref:Uncharacterized protein n=1 Tax=Nocardia pulmonis TaxID=2951408 RepID=A0A9X2J0Z9_9NOCA|nr:MULTISPECIES: hypothetical protein [Nocardia]MCM6777580.1 hypothetical protein [Nocardia pulmonis]MCM6790313.1 hypothetical protein [Nocardia sp. CDC159]